MKIMRILFPRTKCLLCGQDLSENNNEFVCSKCEETLAYNDKDNCQKCGRKAEHIEKCRLCDTHVYSFEKAFSIFVYKDGARNLIHKFKYENINSLKEYFCEKLYDLYSKSGVKADYVTYVPMTFSAFLKRGYNQGNLLAKYFSRLSGVKSLKLLKKIKKTKRQVTLNASQRMLNVKDSFAPIKNIDVSGKNILLIDDVMTTGGTADEICKTLRKSGANAVYVMTVASTEEKTNG